MNQREWDRYSQAVRELRANRWGDTVDQIARRRAELERDWRPPKHLRQTSDGQPRAA